MKKNNLENNKEVWFNKGIALYEKGKLEEAIRCYDKALELDPNLKEALFNKGNVLFDQEKLEEAIRCYDKLLELDPNLKKAWFNKGIVLYDQKKLEEAIRCYDKALELDPNLKEALFNKGIILYDQKKLEEAIRCYDKLLELDPNLKKAWNNKGIALYGIGNLEEAIRCYDKLLELDPNDKKAWSNKGNVLSDQRKLEEAIRCYGKALELDPNLKEALFNKGIVLYDQKKLEEAIKCYDKLLELDPNLKEAWFKKGIALYEIGNLEEAIRCYDKALELDPNLKEAWFKKGIALYGIGNLEEAIRCYDKFLELDPNDKDVWNIKGLYFLIQKELEEAIKCFEKALELDPNFEIAWYNLGDAYFETKNYEQAIKCYKEVIRLDPNSEHAWKKYELSISEKYKQENKVNIKIEDVEKLLESINDLPPEFASRLFYEFRTTKIVILLNKIREELKIPELQFSYLISLVNELKHLKEEKKSVCCSVLVIPDKFNINSLNFCFNINTHLELSKNISEIKKLSQMIDGCDGGLVIQAGGNLVGSCVFEGIKTDIDDFDPDRYRKANSISRSTNGLLFLFSGDGRVTVIYKGKRIINYVESAWVSYPQDLKPQMEQLFQKHQIDKENLTNTLKLIFYMSDIRKGALLTIGDHEEVLKISEPPKINYISWKSTVLNQNNVQALVGLTSQDGATIISNKGKIVQNMTFIRPPVDVEAEIEVGKGSKHSTAAKTSAITNALCIAISEDGPITVYSKGKIALKINL